MREIAERARAVIWLNPEPETYWGQGDSRMDAYARFCHVAKACNTLTSWSASSRTCCAPICRARPLATAKNGWPGAAGCYARRAGRPAGRRCGECDVGADEELIDMIAEEALIDRAKLDPAAKLEDIGLDSVDLVSVIFAIEEKYGIEIAEDAFDRVRHAGRSCSTRSKRLIDAKAA